METVIELKVNDQHLAVRRMPVIASGGCEEVELLFSFSEDWNGYTRAAVFMREDNKENNPPIKVLLPEDRCVLPHEIYRFDGSVLVGVFGLLGDTVKTSTCACLDIARGSPTEGSDPSEVTPDLFAQYLERIATDNKQTLAEMQALADELIKEGVSDSRIYDAVSEYMSENPVSGSKSAYEYAVDGGYKGTEEEFAQKLAREYLTSESDPTVPVWAKASMKPTYTKSEVGLGNVDNVKQYSASNPPPYPVTSVNGKTGAVTVTVPTKMSELENDSEYAQLDDFASWAKAGTKPTYTKSEVGLGNVDNVKQYSASNPPPYPVTSVNGKTGAVTVSVPTKVSQLTNDSEYIIIDDVVTQLLESSEEWMFTLANGSTVTKKVVLG